MRIVAAAASLFLPVAFLWLGFWQLDRAEQKRALFQLFDSSESAAVVSNAMPSGPLPQLTYLRLELQGEFESANQVLLDAMTHAGQAGYHVLTLFRPTDAEQAIVVNRGWVSAPADRKELPALPVSEHERTIRGRIDALPRPGLKLSSRSSPATVSQPRRLLFPTMDELEDVLQVPLAGYQLLLDADESDGFLREWQPRSLPPERHVGYAVQWFGLGIASVCVAAVLWIRELRHRRGHATQ